MLTRRGKTGLCRTCKEKPRASPTTPWCSPSCRRSDPKRRRSKPRPESPQRTRSREKREEYVDVRLATVLRDERCRWCAGPAEHVHHVRGRRQRGAHSLDNCVALCHRCHDLVHSNQRRYRPLLLRLLLLPPTTIGRVQFRSELDD